jgi:hypothetical protein
MSTRISSALGLALLLTACGQSGPGDLLKKITAVTQGEPVVHGDIMCAHPDEDVLRATCTLDRADSHEGLILTVHHADGGFRRFLVTRDGRGVVAADGAEPAVVTVIGPHEIEVASGGDRYRLPATVGSPKTAP